MKRRNYLNREETEEIRSSSSEDDEVQQCQVRRRDTTNERRFHNLTVSEFISVRKFVIYLDLFM